MNQRNIENKQAKRPLSPLSLSGIKSSHIRAISTQFLKSNYNLFENL